MAEKKKNTAQQTEAETEPGFFSDYGYGNGALILHDPPQKPKNTKSPKTGKGTKHNHMDFCTYEFLDFKGYIATDPSYP